jgi:subtilase family serine protease
MSDSWLGRLRCTRSKKSHGSPRPRNGRTLGIEFLESRQYLSASPTELATPDYVAVHTANNAAPLATSGPTGMTPAAVRSAYGFNGVTFSGGVAGTGAGETIAIVDAYDDPNIASDLHQFDLKFGLSDPTFTKVNQNGGSAMPAANKGWATEIALDVEWAHAIAPGANILLVEANSSSMSDLMTAVNTARNASGVVAVSMSWGGGEFSSESSYDSYFTTPAGHVGVSFFVASGDNGAPTSYPAASPNVVSVGGTTLNLSGANYGSESAWSGSGGGPSSFESQPSYQKGVVTQSSTQRTNPDVAYDADPNSGFPVYDSYNNGTATPWGQWGGTSDAAPQWAALTAIADQGRAINGLGSLNGASQLLPALYQLPASDFHDVTTGASSGSPKYSAGVGYDLATGRGTPVANLLIAGLSTWTGSGQTTTAPAAPANFTVQATSTSQVSASWSLSAGATSYSLYEETGTSQPVLVATYGASTTTATVNSLTAGATYSFQIVAANSAGTGASSWLAVTMPSSTKLSAPGNFTVSAASSTQANLSWSLSSGATGYQVYSNVSGQAMLVGTYSSTTTSATIGSLTPGATYTYEVVAYNATTSAATGWLSVTLPTSNTGGLLAPQNFTVTAASSSVAQLSWTASAGATGYSIYWWNGSKAVDLGNVAAKTTSVSVSGLSPGSTDKFYITAFNATTSASTAWVSVTMPSAAVLAAPQNVTATALTSTTGQLSWSGSAGATGYEIFWMNGSKAVAIGVVSASTTSVTISGLSASSSYSFYVLAYNATSSAASATVSLNTPSAAALKPAATAAQLADFAFYYSQAYDTWR